MIIQIRGTSGTGKTTAMRAIMAELGPWTPRYVDGRKKPLYYSNQEGVWVLGHYEEAACGGCDTIGSAPKVYDLIVEVAERYKAFNPIILAEGLLLSEDVVWTQKLVDAGHDVKIANLATSSEVCIERINGRREEAERAAGKPLNVDKVLKRIPTIDRARIRLVNAGVYCRRLSSEQAPRVILQWIKDAERTRLVEQSG